MGFSPKHSTLVTLILNLRTHSITPQFHVVFDDSFSSIHSSSQRAPKIWEELITSPGARYEVMLDNQENPDLADEWLTEGEALARSNACREQILQSSLSPNLEESSPSQLEEVPTQDSSQLQREPKSDSHTDLPVVDEDHQVLDTDFDGDDLPSSSQQTEGTEAPT